MNEENRSPEEELDKVTGGFDDYDRCEWNPNGGGHEWEDYKTPEGDWKRRCKHCGIHT